MKESFIWGGSRRRQEESSERQCKREEGKREDWEGEVSDCSAEP